MGCSQVRRSEIEKQAVGSLEYMNEKELLESQLMVNDKSIIYEIHLSCKNLVQELINKNIEIKVKSKYDGE